MKPLDRSRAAVITAALALALAAWCAIARPTRAEPRPEPSAPLLEVTAWGMPDGGQYGTHHPFGLAGYDGRLRGHRFTLELLIGEQLAGDVRLNPTFRPDRRWSPEFRSSLADYKSASGTYDRGHLACAANHTDPLANEATYVLSNCAPQHKALNRGLWMALEKWIRDQARRPDVAAVWVFTAPMYAPGDLASEIPPPGQPSLEPLTIFFAGDNHVPIPTHFAKSILILGNRSDNPIIVQSWIVPNRAPTKGESIDRSRCTVDLIEHWTGLDLWANLPDEVENKIEAEP